MPSTDQRSTIEWVPPDTSGIAIHKHPTPAQRLKIIQKFIRSITYFLLALLITLKLLELSALNRLNTTINIDKPSQKQTGLSKLTVEAHFKFNPPEEETKSNEELKREEILKLLSHPDPHYTFSRLSEIQNTNNETSQQSSYEYDDLLKIISNEIREALTQGQLGQAQHLGKMGAKLVEHYDPSPKKNNNSNTTKSINYILISRAILLDKSLVQDHQTSPLAVLSQLTNESYENTPPKIQNTAWQTYKIALDSLNLGDFSKAINEFKRCEIETKNPYLTDLALIGQARAVFWRKKVHPKENPTRNVHKHLTEIQAKLKSTSFKTDIDYYLVETTQKGISQ